MAVIDLRLAQHLNAVESSRSNQRGVLADCVAPCTPDIDSHLERKPEQPQLPDPEHLDFNVDLVASCDAARRPIIP